MSQKNMKLDKEIIKKIKLDYLLYLPEGYDENKKWPLILFLHGSGEKGSNVEAVKAQGLPKLLETKEDFPFVVVSPQCPEGFNWVMLFDELHELLKDVKAMYSIDEDRVYLTGLSMGGYGAWSFGSRHPEEFAAVAPVCGGMENKYDVRRLKDTSVWAFHGVKDPVVPIKASEELVHILEECGGNIQFTIYPDLEHDCWTETYNNPELYRWFLKHVRNKEK